MREKQILLAFYGDDFTGSTDAMEVLAKSGYRTLLFLQTPTAEMLESFEGIRCLGVAGTSRAKPPAEMEKELAPIMQRLAQIDAQVVHYKVCSTFDSAPEVGSIGKAIQIARDYFTEQEVIPVLVGAPRLGRYTLFGQHFARMKEQVYRLDRHPVMSLHPVTPMREADLRMHLGQQLDGDKIGLMDILDLTGEEEDVLAAYQRKLEEDLSIVLFDVLDEERLALSGKLIWETTGDQAQFVVGSSGVEYALTAYWAEQGWEPESSPAEKPDVTPADRILVVSGSASVISQQQIENAIQQGFYGMKIPLESLADTSSLPMALLDEAIERLQDGQSVILYTALGPEDEAIEETRRKLAQIGVQPFDMGEFIGRQLGRWTKIILNQTSLRRLVIAGGDTSGFVTGELGIYALEMLLPLSPGAPLCRVYSEDSRMDGLELTLKGGQFGSIDFYSEVKAARS